MQMPGIYLTAILTAIVAVLLFGTLVHRLRQPANEGLLWLAALIVLPLQPLVFHWFRVPLDHWLAAHLGVGPAAHQWLTSLYAPLTEEPAKLVPLLFPAIRRDIRPESFTRYALAIGLGFALGEMWFVADHVAQIPELARLPFYQFGGYFGERLMTCVLHSAFVTLTLWGWQRGHPALGFAGAATAHWLGNFPIFLMFWNVGNLGKPVWSVLVQIWVLVYFVAAGALLSWLIVGKARTLWLLKGMRSCPECGQEYRAWLFSINFGARCYERCPHCRRWHWVDAFS